MRRSLLCIAAACAVAAAPTAGVTQAKSGHGVMCVLHAKLSAKSETTGSTSTAKGHTLIKVRNDGTIEFKTHILNKNNETFTAGHIHQAPAGSPGGGARASPPASHGVSALTLDMDGRQRRRPD